MGSGKSQTKWDPTGFKQYFLDGIQQPSDAVMGSIQTVYKDKVLEEV